MPPERTDVLVIGAGPVGVLLAALLASAGVAVQVWERRTAAPSGSRAIGIHPPSLDVLATIDAASPILEEAALVREGVARSRGRTLGSLSFARASTRHPYVATLDQQRTEAILRQRLHASAPAALRAGVTLTDLQRHRDRVDAAGLGPGGDLVSVSARFVVGADGARSTVRRLLGIGTSGRDYPGRYAMGDFADPEPSALVDVALVDVGPSGVVESFPLPGGRRRYVALIDRALDAPVGPGDVPDGRTAAALAALVRSRTSARPDPDTCSMVSSFRAHRRFADRVGVGRVVLIGDAAHEISPIGGQGMNLGWLDAAELAPLLIDAVRHGEDGPWPAFARRRTAIARRAARQAEANMAFGRPASGAVLLAREVGLRSVLALPSAQVLASVYAMRWA